MTEREIENAYLAILGEWEQPWSKHRKDLAARLWRDLDGQAVLAAVEVLLGREFPPTPGMVRIKAMELSMEQAGVLWAEVWDEIMRGIRNYGHQRWDEIPWSDAVAPFIAHVGYPTFQEVCLGEESKLPVYEAQWRGKWEAWLARQRTQEATQGLPAVQAFEEHRRMRQLRERQADSAVAALAQAKKLGRRAS